MLDTGDPALRTERIFIAYDDVIKSLKLGVIKYLLQNRDRYEEYIDYRFLTNRTDLQLLGWISSIKEKNILKIIGKYEFDYDGSYKSMIDECDDIFKNNMMLDMGKAVSILASQKFTDKIYIYYPYSDDRLKQSIRSDFSRVLSKIQIVTGDFREAIKLVPDKITMYIVNDIDMVNIVAEENKAQRTQFLIANYGYNYIIDEKTKLPILKIMDDVDFEKTHDCQLKEFFPMKTADFKTPFH